MESATELNEQSSPSNVKGLWLRTREFWLNSQKSLAAIAVFAVVAAVVVVIMLWTASDRYRPLYSTSSNYDSSQILELLDGAGIPYQLSMSDGNILVEETRVYEVRKFLAAKGLQEKIPVGIESLDGNSSLGQSQFLEEARYRHALEGELAKSIVTLQSVSYARVHLAVVKESLFTRNTPNKTSSASVVVNLVQGHDLKPGQIDSIVNLVSGSVAGLKPENVRIVDQYGRLLSADASVGDYTVATSRQQDYKFSVEKRLVQQVSDILTPILGPTNFRVQVSADMDFTKVEETEEAYSDPVVRREVKSINTNESNLALGIPGALSNTPPVTDGEVRESDRRKIEKSDIANDYALTGKVTHKVHQQGLIEQLSIAVVLNEVDGVGEDFESKVVSLVESAVGFDGERGDRLVVTSLPFIAVENIEADSAEWYENDRLIDAVKALLATIVGLVLIFKVLTPLMKTLITPKQANSAVVEGGDDLVEGLAASQVNAYSNSVHMMDMPTPDSPVEEQVAHVKLIAEKDTDRVVEVFRRWLDK